MKAVILPSFEKYPVIYLEKTEACRNRFLCKNISTVNGKGDRMESKLMSALGLVFETSFKIGFLNSIDRTKAENFARTSLDFLSDYIPPALIESLKTPLEKWNKIGTGLDDNVAEEKYTRIIFALGITSGSLYGATHARARIIKYSMGDESSDIVWQNADLIFTEDGTLYVVDFKLAGAVSWIKWMLDSSTQQVKYLPVINHGIPVSLSVGEIDFTKFVEGILGAKEFFADLQDVFVEVKGLTQLTCYATDYLITENTSDLHAVCLELIYPISESYRARFSLKNDENTRRLLTSARQDLIEIYREIKGRKSPYGRLDRTFESRPMKKKVTVEKFEKQIGQSLKEIAKRESTSHRIATSDIQGVRKSVEDSLLEFSSRPEPCKAIVLLHSAGSGKTTTIRKHILEAEGRHIVLYMATRLRLIERERDNLRACNLAEGAIIHVI